MDYANDKVAVWRFGSKGRHPKHIPDAFKGSIDTNTLNPPPEVTGVYQNIGGEWIFWARNAPYTNLGYLNGGCDYLIFTTGACTWEIPLQ